MNFNLPNAWLLSCSKDDISWNDHSVFIPGYPSMKIGDVVFIGDGESGFVIQESIIKSMCDSSIELLITGSVEFHPKLQYSVLAKNNFISDDVYGGVAKLSASALLYIRTVLRDPDKYI